MKSGHSPLSPFRRFIISQESRQVTFAQAAIAFAAVVLARNFVESVLEGDQILGFTPILRNSFYSFFDHFFIFYVSSFLWLVLILSLLAHEDARNTARLSVLFSPIILVVPLIDIFLSRGTGYKLGYLEGLGQVFTAVKFFDLKGELVQVSWGQRIEVFAVCSFASTYVWLKRCSWLRTAAAFALVYLALFVHGLPQVLVDIPKAFGFNYGVRAIVGGGLVDVDSQNYSLFMMLLCMPAALLLIGRWERPLLSDLGSGLKRGGWRAVFSFCVLGAVLGYAAFRGHYRMTFVNPYNYLVFGAGSAAFLLASARGRSRWFLLLAWALCVFLSLNVGWTCLALVMGVFAFSRIRRTMPLVLVLSALGMFSIFAQQNTLTLLLPGGLGRVRAFASFRQARECFIQQDWEGAREFYKESLAAGLYGHELSERLAECYVNLGFPDSAIPFFEGAIATGRNDPEPYLGLGGILLARGDFDSTINLYRQAIERRVLPDRFHLEIGRVQFMAGDFKAARSSLRNAALLGARRDVLYQALADLEFFSSDMNEALRLYRKVLSYRPRSAPAYNGMANVYHAQSKFDEALELYSRALGFEPNDPTILNNAGAAYLELGRLDQAYEMVSRALSIRPMLAEAHYNLGRVFELVGSRDEAIKSYKRALEVNPNLAGVRDALRALGEDPK